jgi:peptidoglycan hydrolase-like protein with peptidoglycan-binding domain
MKAVLAILTFLCAVTIATAQGDPLVSSAQQTLKDQGFYYGEVTGRKDADTTAAIRRYQIRNGLKITGDLNAETQKALGQKGNTQPARPTPRAGTAPPARNVQPPAPPAQSDSRRDSLGDRDLDSAEEAGNGPAMPDPRFAPVPRGVTPASVGVFAGTPFETASPDVQQRVLAGAQFRLMRAGFYRSGIDGVYGPAMDFALRAYQGRLGLPPTGRLDPQTLAALRLLPQDRAPHADWPPRQHWRQPRIIAPNGEPIYIPN